VIVTVIEKNGDPLPSRHCCNSVVIMSYDQMTSRDLTGTSFHILIFDESHMLKDRKAKRTIVASSLAKNAQRVLLLSGTPALSRPAELFTQLRLLDSKTFHSFVDFAMRYCDGRQGRFGLEAKGCTNSTELAVILQRTCMIRRLKKDVLNDLPAKRRTIVYLPPSDIESRLAALRSARTACSSVSQGNEHALLMSYYAETGTAKANSVSKHIVEQFFGDEEVEKRKIIVFAHHAIVLDTLCMSLAKKAIGYIRIDGSTIGQRRRSLVQQFQNNPETLCAVLSVTAAGLGITLTAASVVVFAELHWNPGILIQAEDRAHRVGQHDSVCCQYMLAEGTADDQIWPLVQNKLDVLNRVKLSADSFRDTTKSRLEPCPNEQQTRLTSFFERLAADDQQQPDCKRPRMAD